MGFLDNFCVQKVIQFSWIVASLVAIFTWKKFPTKWPKWVKWVAYAVLGITSFFSLYFWWHTAYHACAGTKGCRWYATTQMGSSFLKIFGLSLLWLLVLFALSALARRLKLVSRRNLFAWIVTAILTVFAANDFPFAVNSWLTRICVAVLVILSLRILRICWPMVESGLGWLSAFIIRHLRPIFAHRAMQAILGLAVLWLLSHLKAFLGTKILPHMLGIEFGWHAWFLPSKQSLLPFFIVAGSAAAIIALCYHLVHFLSTKGLKAALTSVAAMASLAGILLLFGTWRTYSYGAREISGELARLRGEVDTMGTAHTLEEMNTLSRYRRLVEYRLGTKEWNAMVFHRLADEPYGLPYRFPGFLIGVEQANRYLIGVPEGDNLTARADKDVKLAGLLSDRRRTFVSHIVEFQQHAPDAHDEEAIKTRLLYNLYENTGYDSAYTLGFRELDTLGITLRARLTITNGNIPDKGAQAQDTARTAQPTRPAEPDVERYSHILVFCMGWNTDQQESIRNYNSLMGFLFDAERKDRLADSLAGKPASPPFRPLVIGLSWPAEWAYLQPLSYLTKAGDADETGLVWGSYLLKKVLKPLKEEFHIPMVLVGHSFGARVLSRAVASNPDWFMNPDTSKYEPGPDSLNKEVDLFVGLQGAVSANRFVKTGALTSGWMEGAPYSHLKAMGTRFLFTWSESDHANPVAAFVTGANHMGGKYGSHFCLQHDTAFWPTVYWHQHQDSTRQHWTYKPEQRFDPDTGWSEAAKGVKGKVFSVDLSKIVKEQPYGKGGKAHSDIYTPEIGNFLWRSILAFAPNNMASGGVEEK